MGVGSSCTGKFDIVSEEEIQAAIKAITEWEEAQKAEQRASQALRTVRKDSFKKAANELNHSGGIVDRLGGPDRVHDVIQVFYRKLFGNAEVRHFFERLSSERMRAKQMKFMRYIMGGPGTYHGNLRCIHAPMVLEGGLDLPKFQIVEGLLQETFVELKVPQDVVEDVVRNVEAAKAAIFTPNPDELVSGEEMLEAASELKHPLITRLGGPHAVQAIIQAFYRKLFRCEELKYFFASLPAERLRNMQFKFMRYLFCGPASYAETGGNMRCVHARMVKEDGLDVRKFNMVVEMLADVMNDQMVAKNHMREILANVQSAKSAIFTPGPEELVGPEELAEEVRAAGLEGRLLERLGGPAHLHELVTQFYGKLFNDEQLKYFFALSSERLKTKQLRLMRYLLGGPAAYAALGGGSGSLRCKHLALIRDKGLDGPKFDRMVGLLKGVMADKGVPQDAVTEILGNVEAARSAIFTPGHEELISKEDLMAAADSLKSETVARLGGSGRVYNVISTFYSKLFNDNELKYFFVSLSDKKLRNKQFKLMTYLFGGPGAYAAASQNGNLRCTHARIIKEYGMDVTKFDRVAGMMLETLRDEGAPEDVVADVLRNVQFAKSAIFTPGPEELVGPEELAAEVRAAGLEGRLLERLGGPAHLHELITQFYGKLFNDERLKYYFGGLTAERLRSKQLKFMRYLIGGPAAYSGDLQLAHAPMLAASTGGGTTAAAAGGAGHGGGGTDGGIDASTFNRMIAHLTATTKELGIKPDVVAEILGNVEAAREKILGGSGSSSGGGGGGGSGGGGGGCPMSAAARSATTAVTPAAASAAAAAAAAASVNVVGSTSLFERLGGEGGVGALVDMLHGRLQADPRVAHLYTGVDMAVQRRQQLGFMRTALGGVSGPVSGTGSSAGGTGSRPSSASSTPASLTLGIAYAHLARDKALSVADFDAIAGHLVACLEQRGAPGDVITAMLAMMAPGKCIIFPPTGAAGGGCPFAKSISVEDEHALDAIIASAAASAAAQTGPVVAVADAATVGATAAAAGGGRTSSFSSLSRFAQPVPPSGGPASPRPSSGRIVVGASATIAVTTPRMSSELLRTASGLKQQQQLQQLQQAQDQAAGKVAGAVSGNGGGDTLRLSLSNNDDSAFSRRGSSPMRSNGVVPRLNLAPSAPTAVDAVSTSTLSARGKGAAGPATPPQDATPNSRPSGASASSLGSGGGGQPGRSGSSFLGASPRPSGPSVLADEDEALIDAIMECPH